MRVQKLPPCQETETMPSLNLCPTLCGTPLFTRQHSTHWGAGKWQTNEQMMQNVGLEYETLGTLRRSRRMKVDLTVCPEGITQQGEVKGIVQRGENNSGTRCWIWFIRPSFGQVQRHRKWDHLHDLNSFLVPHWTQSIFWLGKLWKQWEVIFSTFGPRSYKIDCRVIRISEWEINPMGPYTAVVRFKK